MSEIFKYDAVLIIDDSEKNADMYYATGFLAPDPFVFIQTVSEKIIAISDLEIDRAKVEAKVDRVIPLSRYEEKLRRKGIDLDSYISQCTSEILKELQVRKILVPYNFGTGYLRRLEEKGFTIDCKDDPFIEKRLIKSKIEIGYITECLRCAERAIDEAIGLVRSSTVRNGYLYTGKERLTSEKIKKIISRSLLEMNCIGGQTIVAIGTQGCDPHNHGSGPLMSDMPIIIDLFPRSMKTRYFSDITRTVVKGKASTKLKKMFGAVKSAQEKAFLMIKDGVDGTEVHTALLKLFEKRGFKTGKISNRMQGFFHGTGHGLGLDIHEVPRIGKINFTLKKGNVVTVEPGLYYSEIGGVRLEDIVVVTEDGCKNLTTYPKELEIT